MRLAARGKGDRLRGAEALVGAACASDAFYPFPDAIEVCLEAGVTAFVQPGGSLRDADVVAAVDDARRGDAADRNAPLPPLNVRPRTGPPATGVS